MVKKYKRAIYKGLPNIGNTCYMNSVLQCLFSTELFIQFFTNNQITLKGDHIPVTISFVNFLKEYFSKNSENLADPQEFKDIFSKRFSLFKGNNQQDAHEFLNCLLEAVHSNIEISTNCDSLAMNEIEYINLLGTYNEVYLQNLIKESRIVWSKFLVKENTEIVRIFYGQLRSTVECQKCFKQENTFDPFNTLQLPIFYGSHEIDLETILKNFEKSEIIPLDPQNSWKCPQCNDRTVVKKTMQIWKLPKILIIQLKRFDSFTRKIPVDVQFPFKGLKLYDYGYNKLSENYLQNLQQQRMNYQNNYSQIQQFDIQIKQTEEKLNKFNKLFEKKYNLYGIVNHHGNSSLGGHYTSMVKLKKPHDDGNETTKPFRWCIMNDGTTKEISIYTKNASSKETYLLFYKQTKVHE